MNGQSVMIGVSVVLAVLILALAGVVGAAAGLGFVRCVSIEKHSGVVTTYHPIGNSCSINFLGSQITV